MTNKWSTKFQVGDRGSAYMKRKNSATFCLYICCTYVRLKYSGDHNLALRGVKWTELSTSQDFSSPRRISRLGKTFSKFRVADSLSCRQYYSVYIIDKTRQEHKTVLSCLVGGMNYIGKNNALINAQFTKLRHPIDNSRAKKESDHRLGTSDNSGTLRPK